VCVCELLFHAVR